MNGDVVIRAVDLKKVYRLYAKPSYRFRDMFGLLGDRPGAYTEHAALDGVNLEVRRGEKVAIIGRNGAGKSTFLKLVTNVIQPTSGVLEVNAHVHALLQIGTGFHPDFTGRENVYAYFAQLGITGKEADRRCAESIEFAELEEYIDQPVKTYSTGMAVRLMFATSTAIAPDLLVLDEVLGVGDAYFSQKSFSRMHELCERDGATLLLVTHDVYSAVKLCERVLWIDRGIVVLDGNGTTVVKAYEDSIRQQEERRLRLKKQQQLRTVSGAPLHGAGAHVIVEIQSKNNQPQPTPLYISRAELFLEGRSLGLLPFGDLAFDAGGPHLQREGGSWGESSMWHGRVARPLLNYGSPFHKAAGVFDAVRDGTCRLVLEVDYWSDQSGSFTVRGFAGTMECAFGELVAVPGSWSTYRAEALAAEGSAGAELSVTGRQGTGAIDVLDVRALDDCGKAAHLLEHGRGCSFEIDYRINDPAMSEAAQVLLAFHRDGVHDVSRVITRSLEFDAAARATGTIVLRLPRLLFGSGNYTVTVMIASEGYYDRQQAVFYSINPGVYALVSRVLEIVVVGGGIVASGTAVVSEGEWALT